MWSRLAAALGSAVSVHMYASVFDWKMINDPGSCQPLVVFKMFLLLLLLIDHSVDGRLALVVGSEMGGFHRTIFK